jgi:hypothetical protein
MTRNETLCCVHEPFGDAFYYGPERLSSRFEEDEAARVKSGFNNSTYQTVFDNIDNLRSEVRLLPPIFAPALSLRKCSIFLVSFPFFYTSNW